VPVAPSFEDLLTQGRAELQARRPDLALFEGDVTEAQLHASGAMADAVLRYAAQGVLETFLDGAKGNDDVLTDLVDDRYNIQRQEASAAEVIVTFSRASAGLAGTIDADTQVATAIGADGSTVVFTTDVNLAISAGAGSWAVAATAVETGRSGNIQPQTLRVLDTLFDTFTAETLAVASGGNDRETNEELITRARLREQTLELGTLAALESSALGVATVRVAIATEDNTGLATLLVSDSDGNSTLQMVSDVETAIESVRCAGSIVTVAGGTRLEVDVAVVVTLVAGLSATVLETAITSAVESRINRLRNGERSYGDRLTAAIIAVDEDGILSVELNYTSADPITVVDEDIVPAITEVIRVGSVTVTEA